MASHPQKTASVALISFALGLLVARDVWAIPLLDGFGGPTGYGLPQFCLHPNDDGSYAGPPPTSGFPAVPVDITRAFPLGINFFGVTHRAMFVNTNGNISFRVYLSERTPVPFPVMTMSRQPMIAPWWADVDTRGGGQPMRNNICFHVEPGRVVVTWNNVGYFASHDDRPNDFQLILTQAEGCAIAGDFDIELRYNRCQWTTGDASGGSGGLGGTPALVGFDAGNGRDHYEHPMSRTTGILDVCRTTNVPGGAPGLWRFQVRNSAASGCSPGAPCTVAGRLGVCAQGAEYCDATGSRCVQTNGQRDERCNGYDDDCDGMVDDGDDLCSSGYVCDRGACVARCFGGRACPAGLTCTAASVCLDDACARVSCQVGQRCEAGVCVGVCDGVTCPAGQVCRVGRCFDPCDGVGCGTTEVCDRRPGPTAGLCVRGCQCAGCPPAQQCQSDGSCVPDDCVGVRCPTGSYCRGGRCRDECESTLGARVCPRGEVCRMGECVPERVSPEVDAGVSDGAIADADPVEAGAMSDHPSPVDTTPGVDVGDDGTARADVADALDGGRGPTAPPSGACECNAVGARGAGARLGPLGLACALAACTRRRRRAARRGIVWLIGIAVAAGCADPSPASAPIALEQFNAALNGASCDAVFRCGEGSDRVQLRSLLGSAAACSARVALHRDAGIDDLRRLVAAGAVRYDPVAAGRCIARAAATCAFEWDRTGACAEVFTGTVATDGPCWRHEQCAGDAYCFQSPVSPPQRCPGQCRPRLPLGAECSGDGAQCSRRGVEGRLMCGRDGSSPPRSVCGELRDGTPAPEGAPCGFVPMGAVYYEIPCAPGLYCPNSLIDHSPATCRRLPTRGMPCSLEVDCWQSQCVPAADLRSATCGDLLVRSRVGERCSPLGTWDPAAGQCNPIAHLTCNAGGTCESNGDGTEGSGCQSGAASLYTCNAGLYCDRTTERCRPKKPSGEACEDAVECLETCSRGTCGRVCAA